MRLWLIWQETKIQFSVCMCVRARSRLKNVGAFPCGIFSFSHLLPSERLVHLAITTNPSTTPRTSQWYCNGGFKGGLSIVPRSVNISDSRGQKFPPGELLRVIKTTGGNTACITHPVRIGGFLGNTRNTRNRNIRTRNRNTRTRNINTSTTGAIFSYISGPN